MGSMSRVSEIDRRAREKEQRELERRPEYWVKLLYHTWTAEDVARWYAEADALGARIVVRDVEQIRRMEIVPNEPFRQAFFEFPENVRGSVCARIIKELRKI